MVFYLNKEPRADLPPLDLIAASENQSSGDGAGPGTFPTLLVFMDKNDSEVKGF